MSFLVLIFKYLLFFKDLLPDDCECDWTEDEFFSDNPRLLVSSNLSEAEAGSYCKDLAKILSLPVHHHDLPVSAVCGHTASSLHRWVLKAFNFKIN